VANHIHDIHADRTGIEFRKKRNLNWMREILKLIGRRFLADRLYDVRWLREFFISYFCHSYPDF